MGCGVVLESINSAGPGVACHGAVWLDKTRQRFVAGPGMAGQGEAGRGKTRFIKTEETRVEQELISGRTQTFQMSKETSDLIRKLESTTIGEIVTYDELSEVAHGDVLGRCRSNLTSARKHLENEKRILFGCIRKVGLKRATDIEVVAEGEKGLSRVRRAARRASKRTVCIKDFDKLPEEVKVRHNAALSILGALDLATRPSKVKQIQAAVKTANDRLAIGQTLDLFSR